MEESAHQARMGMRTPPADTMFSAARGEPRRLPDDPSWRPTPVLRRTEKQMGGSHRSHQSPSLLHAECELRVATPQDLQRRTTSTALRRALGSEHGRDGEAAWTPLATLPTMPLPSVPRQCPCSLLPTVLPPLRESGRAEPRRVPYVECTAQPALLDML